MQNLKTEIRTGRKYKKCLSNTVKKEFLEFSHQLSKVVTRPKKEHNPDAMTRDATTERTALKASPHLLFTISILPVKNKQTNKRYYHAVIGEYIKRGSNYKCNARAKDSLQKYRRSIKNEQERQ